MTVLLSAIDERAGRLQGAVYEIPAYGRAISGRVEAICRAYDEGRIAELVMLLPGRTDTRWFQRAVASAPSMCYVEGRVKFPGYAGAAPFPSVVVYAGPRRALFRDVFNEIGIVFRRVDGPHE